MRFEYNSTKSRSNKAKHGIDFDAAQEMWSSRVVRARLSHTGEERWMAVGLIDGKYWTAIITYRGNAIRLISVRRSRSKEIEFYEQD